MKLFKNLILSFASFVILLLLLEFVVLKFIIPTTDVARVEHKDGVTRYISSQTGTTKFANVYSSPFSINENGWNSHHKKYFIERNHKTRIAVIGDSYIAALEPGYSKAIPFLLEQQLGPENFEEGDKNNKILADYVVKNISSIAKEKQIRLVFAMNGDTQSIYHPNSNEETNVALKLNDMMKQTVRSFGGEFIDLQKTFRDDYKVNHKKFEFERDGHWNPYGHQVVTTSVAKTITSLIPIR